MIVQSDHSHGGADALGVWGGTSAAYRAHMQEQTVQAILAAVDGMRPAALRYGVADATALLCNQFDYDAANAGVDGEMRVLQAVGPDRDPRHTLVNFSAHATVLGSGTTKIHGDWVQAFNPQLERAIGGSVVTMVGTLGRTQPADRACSDKGKEGEAAETCRLDEYAARLAERARAAIGNAQPLPTHPEVDGRSYLITDITTSPLILGLEYAGGPLGIPLNRAQAPPWQVGPVIGTGTATMRIGDVIVHAMPGEAYPQIPGTVRSLSPSLRGQMTAGLANDQLGYLIAPYEAYPEPIRRSVFNERGDEVSPIDNDNYFFNVSHTMGERVICSLLRGVGELAPGANAVRERYDRCAVFGNDLARQAGSGRPVRRALVALLCALACPASAAAATTRAGVAVVDASWHVGASAGQYASDGSFVGVHGVDPTTHSIRRNPSYGIQSRLSVRAVVLEGSNGARHAIVKSDLYIPQDLLYRRAAQLLEASGKSGIGRRNLTYVVTHDHSSPYYSSTSWGVWAFQDVVDIRFFEYYAQRIAQAVESAAAKLRPVRIGVAVSQFDKTHRHSFGPAIADDGTPAGYPQSESLHDMTVVRIDELSGKPYAMLLAYSLHPEFLEGNDLISADYVAPLERMIKRRTRATMIYMQSAVGTAEPERSQWHSLHKRLEFSHRDYAQAELGAKLMADAAVDTWQDVARRTPADPQRFVPFSSALDLAGVDRWFPGPLSHPVPGVSNCRTDALLAGKPALPLVGLPDCASPLDLLGVDAPAIDPGVSTDDLQRLGIPIPENYSAPGYTGLEEDVSVHLQALRLGPILFAFCSCEQWTDQARNIITRTNERQGDQWLGWDWTSECAPDPSGATWSCADPRGNGKRLTGIAAPLIARMRAQVGNDAAGWNDPSYVLQAESEPVDPEQIKGNYTHSELPASQAYALTIPIAMANDYNGYIATYREYQRGDHYRKALTAWGPHSSDYLATRLVGLAAQLHGGPAPPLEPLEAEKVPADLALNDARASAIGALAQSSVRAYETALPDDGGGVVAVAEPRDVRRFGAAFFSWTGGSNFTDNPVVVVERRKRDGGWRSYAGQAGEVVVTLDFPQGGDVTSYLSGGHRWTWTAHWEAFTAREPLLDRARSTPLGTYRFVVRGRRRSGGRAVPYAITSSPFTVSRWDGVTVERAFFGRDGRLRVAVGPRRLVDVPGSPALRAEIGPIDYPDSYSSPARFIRANRTAFRDPAAPADAAKVEWYCFTCSFRPWADVARPRCGTAVVARGSRRPRRVRLRPAKADPGVLVSRRLPRGSVVALPAGAIVDEHGERNGDPGAAVVARGRASRGARAAVERARLRSLRALC